MNTTRSAISSSAPKPDGSAPAPPARLELRGIAVSRGGRPVLRDLSIQVGPGEVFGLLGSNGAGKTTAFHVLTGLLPAQRGQILVDGRASGPSHRDYRAAIGVVFQSPALDLRLTARENLQLAARLYGLRSSEARRRTDELLARADLPGRVDEPLLRLSGGMRRRVEIARALLHDPQILILDEPTTGLDEAAFRGTWSHLLELRRDRGLTLLLTTHRPDEAERCDRLAILDDGRVVACDSPNRLRARLSGDMVILETPDPVSIAAMVTQRLGLPARVLDGTVVLECARGHELVPKVVEALPEGAISAVSVRRPGLGEVFLELTGRTLHADESGGSGGPS